MSSSSHLGWHRVPVVPDIDRLFGDTPRGFLVSGETWFPTTETVRARVMGADRTEHATFVRFLDQVVVESRCGCAPDSPNGRCQHLHALILATSGKVIPTSDPSGSREWKAATSILSRPDPTIPPTRKGDGTGQVGLRFAVSASDNGLLLAPAIRASRSSVWSSLASSWAQPEHTEAIPPAQRALIAAIADLAPTGSRTWLTVADLGPDIWALLSAAATAGVHLLRASTTAGAVDGVHLHPTAAIDLITSRRPDGGVDLHPHLLTENWADETPDLMLIGLPHHGVAWYDKRLHLNLAPLRSPLNPLLARLAATHSPVTIPSADLHEFTATALPRLQAAITVHDPDNAFTTRTVDGPIAVLHIRASHDPHVFADYVATWKIQYVVDETPERYITAPHQLTGAELNDSAELTLWRQLSEQITAAAPIVGASGASSAAVAEFIDTHAAAFHRRDDLLLDLDDVPDFRPAIEPPTVHFDAGPDGLGRDWLNLAITVDIDGARIPLEQIIVDLIRPGVSGGFVSRKDEPRGNRIEAVLGGVEAGRSGDGGGVGRAGIDGVGGDG